MLQSAGDNAFESSQVNSQGSTRFYSLEVNCEHANSCRFMELDLAVETSLEINCIGLSTCSQSIGDWDIDVGNNSQVSITSSGIGSLENNTLQIDGRGAHNLNASILCKENGCGNFAFDLSLISEDVPFSSQHLAVTCLDNSCLGLDVSCPPLIGDASGSAWNSSCEIDLSNDTAEGERIIRSYSGLPFVDIICGEGNPSSCGNTILYCGDPPTGIKQCAMNYSSVGDIWECVGECSSHFQEGIENSFSIGDGFENSYSLIASESNSYLNNQIINCSSLDENIGKCSVTCTSSACASTVIHCPMGTGGVGICTIFCGPSSCMGMTIYGESSADVIIECEDAWSCDHLTVHHYSLTASSLSFSVGSTLNHESNIAVDVAIYHGTSDVTNVYCSPSSSYNDDVCSKMTITDI